MRRLNLKVMKNKIDFAMIISAVVGVVVLIFGFKLLNVFFGSGKKNAEEVRELIGDRISDPEMVSTDKSKEILDMKVVQIMAELNQFPVNAKDLSNILTGCSSTDLEYIYKKFGIQERRPFGIGRQQLDLFGFFDATLWNKKPMKAIWIYEPYIYR